MKTVIPRGSEYCYCVPQLPHFRTVIPSRCKFKIAQISYCTQLKQPEERFMMSKTDYHYCNPPI